MDITISSNQFVVNQQQINYLAEAQTFLNSISLDVTPQIQQDHYATDQEEDNLSNTDTDTDN